MKRLGVALIIMLTFQILGHYIGSFSLALFPILMLVLTLVISDYYKKSFYFTAILILLLLIINDLLIRKYAAGTHDQVGKALCNISFGISFIITILSILIEYLNKYKREPLTKRMLSLIFVTVISGTTWILFWNKLSDI